MPPGGNGGARVVGWEQEATQQPQSALGSASMMSDDDDRVASMITKKVRRLTVTTMSSTFSAPETFDDNLILGKVLTQSQIEILDVYLSKRFPVRGDSLGGKPTGDSPGGKSTVDSPGGKSAPPCFETNLLPKPLSRPTSAKHVMVVQRRTSMNGVPRPRLNKATSTDPSIPCWRQRPPCVVSPPSSRLPPQFPRARVPSPICSPC